MSRHRHALFVLLAALAMVAAACGDSDEGGSDTTTTSAAATGASSTTAAAAVTSSTAATASSTSTPSGEGVDEVERIQTQLNAVGCFSGAVDGIDGPETTAAVEAFQEAQGLDVDGIPGPQTQGALDDAVASGETVCTGGGGDEGGGGDDSGGGVIGDSTVQLASASYSAGFTVLGCDNPSESTITLRAENENSIELDVMATDGTGTLSVSGGTEQDSVSLTGDVESVVVGDTGAVNVTGTFTGDNLAGETFALTGSCA